jgi:hypothetical protein
VERIGGTVEGVQLVKASGKGLAVVGPEPPFNSPPVLAIGPGLTSLNKQQQPVPAIVRRDATAGRGPRQHRRRDR